MMMTYAEAKLDKMVKFPSAIETESVYLPDGKKKGRLLVHSYARVVYYIKILSAFICQLPFRVVIINTDMVENDFPCAVTTYPQYRKLFFPIVGINNDTNKIFQVNLWLVFDCRSDKVNIRGINHITNAILHIVHPLFSVSRKA